MNYEINLPHQLVNAQGSAGGPNQMNPYPRGYVTSPEAAEKLKESFKELARYKTTTMDRESYDLVCSNYLKSVKPLLKGSNVSAEFKHVGSYARGNKVLGSIDLLVVTEDPSAIITSHCSSKLDIVLQHTATRVSGIKDYRCVEVQIANPENYATMALHWVGPIKRNILMRKKAIYFGLKLNQHGLWKGEHKLHTPTVKDIFRILDMEYRFPELG